MSRAAAFDVHVGTAAWAIPREVADRFASTGTGLQRYASRLHCAEINSTFKRRHRASTFERWAASVPASFRFAVKVPAAITHDAKLASPRAGLEEFFGDVHHLGDRLGPVLVQLAASTAFEPRRAGTFFRALRSLHQGDVVCEPRHPSWYEPRAAKLLVDHAVARVAADPPRPAIASEPGGSPSLRYYRWHGSPRVYYSSYDDARLAQLAAVVREERVARPVWVVFDNTASGAATADALRFRELLSIDQCA